GATRSRSLGCPTSPPERHFASSACPIVAESRAVPAADPKTKEKSVQRRCHRNGGFDPRNPSEHDVPREARERPRGDRAYLRSHAQELHPHPDRRQGQGRDDALRSDQGSHHLPYEVTRACPALAPLPFSNRFASIETVREDRIVVDRSVPFVGADISRGAGHACVE